MSELGQYLDEIGEFSLLSKEEEWELAKCAQEGDTEARNALVNANLRLVVFLAKKVRSQYVMLEDLIQIGNRVLLVGVKRFDPHRQVKLSHFLAPRIFGELLCAAKKARRQEKLQEARYSLIDQRWAFRNGDNHRPQFENVILSRVDRQRAEERERAAQKLERALVADIRPKRFRQKFGVHPNVRR